MSYVDGFLAAVPLANKEAYLEHSKKMEPLLKEYGVLGGSECWGDDLPEGKLTDFRMAVKAEADETVVFSWLVWPNKETRDAAWAKMMSDPRMAPDANPMPFDGKRMIYGGFEKISEM